MLNLKHQLAMSNNLDQLIISLPHEVINRGILITYPTPHCHKWVTEKSKY